MRSEKKTFHGATWPVWTFALLLAAGMAILAYGHEASAAGARTGARGCKFRAAAPWKSHADGTGSPKARWQAISLGQNVPNPFNPQTEIEFTLASPGKTTLRVFDVQGRLVATLVDGVRPAGTNRVRWLGVNDRGQKVASGVYLYQLEANGTKATRSMIVTK